MQAKLNTLVYYFLHDAPRYFSEFFSSFTAVSTSSNVSADTAQRACFCAWVIELSSIECEGWLGAAGAGAGAGGAGGAGARAIGTDGDAAGGGI